MSKIHLPALGVLLAQLAAIATAVVQVPQLTDTKLGKAAVTVLSIASLLQSFTKPLPKQP